MLVCLSHFCLLVNIQNVELNTIFASIKTKMVSVNGLIKQILATAIKPIVRGNGEAEYI
jgi:hypothetical protein